MAVLHDINLVTVGYVVANLRDANKREIYPLRPHDNPVLLAYEVCGLISNCGRGRVAFHGGKPAAVVGVYESWPGVWGLMMFGTDSFKSVVIDVLRWLRHTMRDLTENHGARRLQSETLAGDVEAERFFVGLGAMPEGPPLRHYGKNGESYQRFVWFAGENDQFTRRTHEVSHVLQ